MKQMKHFSLLIAAILMIIGTFLISYSLFDLFQQKKELNAALIEGKEKISYFNHKEQESVREKEHFSDISFKKGEVIGILKIPRLQAELPIIEGTDEDELEIGVGHYSSTVFPGEPDQILLSGHRDTVFRKLGELEIGDLFTIMMPYGQFSYEISDSQIVDANDTTVIQSTAPIETLTVSTCYPFSFIGDAPYRYVLTAYRIDVERE
ncbi:sortase A [Cytobacillus eiseniae]|uniref:Sortase A n=1 Tax=Cytobacillus eiseniae TaxID=762947 RepID=A0ABS4RG23_9BACI|nr:class D sortase [Cytobacillus eiseniae]MBP2241855.1 sortase A [Cytobacillus eiseniae]